MREIEEILEGKFHIGNSCGKLRILCRFDFIYYEEKIFPELYLNEVPIFDFFLHKRKICFELLENESETSQKGRSQWPRLPSLIPRIP